MALRRCMGVWGCFFETRTRGDEETRFSDGARPFKIQPSSRADAPRRRPQMDGFRPRFRCKQCRCSSVLCTDSVALLSKHHDIVRGAC